MKLRVVAASATARVCGPTVSWVWEMGTTPPRLTSPTVGLIPTTPLTFAGQTMLPSVSLPRDTAVKFPAAAAADPELEPQALRSREYGLSDERRVGKECRCWGWGLPWRRKTRV